MMFTTRFAPSPTGGLHLGHAFSALTAWSAAKAVGGRCLLRIEDTDFTRCRPEHDAAILDDLAWLGLDWETPVRRQSEHRPAYETALNRLRGMGVLYRCFRTRKEIMALAGAAPHANDPDDAAGFQPGPESHEVQQARLEAGEAFAWRLSLPAAQDRLGGFDHLTWVEEGQSPGLKHADPTLLGDMVMGRKDIGAGYVIASVIDDADQGITHIIRGEDLAPVTAIQRILQALLDLPTPVYRHHRLILGPDGKRLAKRDHAMTLAHIRDTETTADQVRRQLGF